MGEANVLRTKRIICKMQHAAPQLHSVGSISQPIASSIIGIVSSTSVISDTAFDQTAQLLNRCDVTPVFSSILSESFPAL